MIRCVAFFGGLIMLILSRRKLEDIIITVGGQQIVVRLVELRPGKARIGVEAPVGIVVHRREVHELIHKCPPQKQAE
jgi:carbon storage regulator CsrA